MFERSALILKVAFGVVLALVLYRLGLAIVHINPLYHVTIPALPELASTAEQGGSNTNGGAPRAAGISGTNQVAHKTDKGTNTTSATTNLIGGSSNLLQQVTNSSTPMGNLEPMTNRLAAGTNSLARGTNAAPTGTNVATARTNRLDSPAPGRGPQMAQSPMLPGLAGMMPPGAMPGMPGMGNPAPSLPAEIQARVDRVIESEILAPVMRPLPMALLGIAGSDVFLRAPNGQTGLVKEGDELGGVKLVRIGVNRVVVEEKGEQKELTIFAGLGGESLLSNQKNISK